MNKPGSQTKPAEVRWVFELMGFEVLPVDRYGRQVGKAIKVSGVQEAHDICEARNKASRSVKQEGAL